MPTSCTSSLRGRTWLCRSRSGEIGFIKVGQTACFDLRVPGEQLLSLSLCIARIEPLVLVLLKHPWCSYVRNKTRRLRHNSQSPRITFSENHVLMSKKSHHVHIIVITDWQNLLGIKNSLDLDLYLKESLDLYFEKSRVYLIYQYSYEWGKFFSQKPSVLWLGVLISCNSSAHTWNNTHTHPP